MHQTVDADGSAITPLIPAYEAGLNQLKSYLSRSSYEELSAELNAAIAEEYIVNPSLMYTRNINLDEASNLVPGSSVETSTLSYAKEMIPQQILPIQTVIKT